MSEVLAGLDALDALNREDDAGNNTEYTSFKSGNTFLVKVLGTSDLTMFYNHGIFNAVNSFVPEKPSKKNAKGYPVEDLTPWDLAYKYHADKSKEFNDYHSKEAYKYRAKQRFAMGFIDLDTGEPIIIDLSKNQAKAIHGAIKKYEKRIGTMAFELSKQGESTGTTVSLSPFLDDLTDKQQKHFDEAPESFDMKLFEGINYEADEDEQIKLLAQSGFDVSLIGKKVKTEGSDDEAKPIDAEDDSEEFPF